tara:strand:+ start:1211 stop:1375 length:165 start_codon:yes stop_codon:yes gene_type:complete
VYYTQNLKTNMKLRKAWALEHRGIPMEFDFNVSPNVANVVTNPEALFSLRNTML